LTTKKHFYPQIILNYCITQYLDFNILLQMSIELSYLIMEINSFFSFILKLWHIVLIYYCFFNFLYFRLIYFCNLNSSFFSKSICIIVCNGKQLFSIKIGNEGCSSFWLIGA